MREIMMKPKASPHPDIPLGTKCSVWLCTDYAHPHSRIFDGKSPTNIQELLHISETGVITLHTNGPTHTAAELTPAQAVAWFTRNPHAAVPTDVKHAADNSRLLSSYPQLWTGHLRRLRDGLEFSKSPREEILRRMGEVLVQGVKADAFKSPALAKAVKSVKTKEGDPAAVATAFLAACKAAGQRIEDAPNGMMLGCLAAALDAIHKAE